MEEPHLQEGWIILRIMETGWIIDLFYFFLNVLHLLRI